MILRRLILVAFALMVAAWWNAAPLEAQTMTTGSVHGTVTNPKKAVVANAEVLLTNNAKGTIQTVKTNLSGQYSFGLLDPGSYTLTVTYTGFQPATKVVTIPVGEQVTVDFQLSVTPQGPQRAPGSMLNTHSANVGVTISRLQIAQVPNPGNDMTYVAQFSPGTVMNTTGGGTGNFANYGMPATSNRFSVDGFDKMAPFQNVNYAGATGLLLGTSEVREANVVSNGYTGTYREFAGAGVDYLTSSGGSDLHGNATYYWNQRMFNANNFFNNTTGTPRPFDGENQWQGSLGGPLKRGRAFFFIDSEGLRALVPATATVVTPSQDFQTHLDTYLQTLGLGDVGTYYDSMFSVLDNAPNYSSALDNQPPGITIPPGTSQPEPTGDGCGNFNLDPAFYGPGALPCSFGYTSARDGLSTDWYVDSRIDVNLSARDRMFGRFERESGNQKAYLDPISSSYDVTATEPAEWGQIGWTHDFGPSAANQFLLGLQYYSHVFDQPAAPLTGTSFTATTAIADGTFFNTAGPNPCVNPPIGQGFNVLIGGENCALPHGEATTDFEVSDDFSKVSGANTFKMGGNFRRLDLSDHNFGTLQSGLMTVNTINDFFSGGASGDSLVQSFPQSLEEPIAYYTAGGYMEDDWRYSKTLSLTFAVRAEHDSNFICRHLCFAQLAGPFSQIATGQNQSQLDNIPYNQAIKINQLQALPGLQNVLIEPRVGFAWQPFGASGNTVVRGGAGIFYNMLPAQIANYMAENPPLNATFTSTGDYMVSIAAADGSPSIFADSLQANTDFQNGFYTGQTLSQIEAADTSFSSSLPGIFTTEATTKIPQYQKWSLELQRQFGGNTSVTLSYVGNHGVHEPLIENSANAFGFADLPTAQPDQRFGKVSVLYSGGNSNYNGGSVSVTHRFTGFGTGIIQGSYTFSRALDEVSNGGFAPFSPTSLMSPQDPLNIVNSYGPADYNVPQSGNVNAVWEIPFRKFFGKRGSSYLLDGWQISGAFIAHSGFPYSVIDSSAFGGLTATIPENYFGQVLPVFSGGPTGCQVTSAGVGCLAPPSSSLSCSQPTAAACEFNVSGENEFGGGERNMFRGPRFMNFDAALMKQTKLPFWESARVGIGVQAFNVLNHPNFGLPINDASSPEFGEILNTVSSPTSPFGAFLGGDGSPRILQFKAQFTF